MVGPNFRVGKKIGCGNFGELRLGKCHIKSIEFFFNKIIFLQSNNFTEPKLGNIAILSTNYENDEITYCILMIYRESRVLKLYIPALRFNEEYFLMLFLFQLFYSVKLLAQLKSFRMHKAFNFVASYGVYLKKF